jgi:hypothetical protein
VRFAYITSLRVEGKQTHILCKPKTLGTETASYKVLPLENNVYSLDNEELHGLYSSHSIIRVIKVRRMRWAGHVARMEEVRGAYSFLVWGA